MNYLILQDFSGKAVPFIFPERVSHADMREQLPYVKVLSAGRVIFKRGTFTCFRESGIELEIKDFSAEHDAEIIVNSFLDSESDKASCKAE